MIKAILCLNAAIILGKKKKIMSDWKLLLDKFISSDLAMELSLCLLLYTHAQNTSVYQKILLTVDKSFSPSS